MLFDLEHKPEYFFRPWQVFVRLYRSFCSAAPGDRAKVKLPWGTKIAINPQEGIGRAIWLSGAYELAAMETIWRMVRPGDTFLDVGANIGYVTSLLATRVGNKGKGFAIEAHPQIADRLEENLALMAGQGNASRDVKVFRLALNSRQGALKLFVPKAFDTNQGLASLVPPVDGDGKIIDVLGERLDAILDFGIEGPIHFMKIDIEGAELSAMEGAGDWIANGRIQNILFEEHNPYPTAVCRYLEKYHYSIYRIEKTFWGPRLVSPSTPPKINWEPGSFLATQLPKVAEALLGPRGWSCLRF